VYRVRCITRNWGECILDWAALAGFTFPSCKIHLSGKLLKLGEYPLATIVAY